MERWTVKRLLVAAILIIPLVGCPGLTQIAQGIADNAPFAKPPVIVKVGARQWDGDPEHYNRGGSFEFIVKHGLANELTIKENGIDLARVSSPPVPGALANTVYLPVEDVANDTNAQTTIRRIRIYTKESLAAGPFVPPPDGTLRTYSFVERSINPKAMGKDLISDPTDIKIRIWARTPVIAVFTTSPSNPATNVPLTINWRANDAKKIELLERLGFVKPDGTSEERESVIQSNVFNPGPAGSFDGTKTLNVTPTTTAIVFRAWGAGGAMVSDYQELMVSGPVACPQNANGRKIWFTFCLECTGRPPEGISEPACTEADALARLNRFYKSEFCEVKNKACFGP
ncbi:hypothetical protein [Hyalangium sp.]|uniref:hypothetical protein n=1 Tax=Hyalangium sp. TaxID=2028555 RepID=UPI002D4C80F1|nr:hypothetical protein [Hyalangium sp.]HYH97349.1 hypothetical protein [Hyalangium sp.]